MSNFRIFYRSFLGVLLAFLLLLPISSVNAQVTIGSTNTPHSFSVLELVSNEGGLRLPHLSTDQRGQLDISDYPEAALGLVIFNTDNNCLEYWNGSRWVSLCEGNSQMTIYPEPCLEINSDGTGCDGEFAITDPDCPEGPFEFAIVAGSGFAFFASTNEADGKFSLHVEPNTTTSPRSIVVRVTSSCTGLFREFIFVQVGQECPPELDEAPVITASSTELCVGGAVYLSVSASTPYLENLIWTRNGVEIARGVNHIAVTQPGVYDLSVGFVGCGQRSGNERVVTMSSNTAPSPVSIIVGENAGFVCDPEATVQLFASAVASGTIVWYRDGERTTLSGQIISAGIGTWFAVVELGTCSSLASNEVEVILYHTSGVPVETPVFTVNNESATGGVSVCIGGNLRLEVTNPQVGITYTWYVNTTQVGTGAIFFLNMAGISNDFILQVRATGNNLCSNAAVAQASITSVSAPAAPVVVIFPETGALCNGEATLEATHSVATDFIWFRNGVEIAGESYRLLNVTQLGNYSARAVVGGCVSVLSNVRDINVASVSNTNVTISGNLTNLRIGDTRTISATMADPQGASFNWTVSNATILGGQGTSSIVVRFDAGNAGITLVASNVCGEAYITNAGYFANITVAPDCVPVQISSHSPTSRSVTVTHGSSATLNIGAAIGTLPRTYRWYSNTTYSTTGGTPVSGANTNTLSTPANLAVGTHFFYAVVTNCENAYSATSQIFTVTVQEPIGQIPVGSGNLSGRTCFDIGYSTQPGCGAVDVRQSSRRVFTTHPTETYIFVPAGSVTNVRFAFENSHTIPVINDVTWSGNVATVHFNPALDTEARGFSRTQALRANLHAIFEVGNVTHRVSIRISVADCICCPGLIIPGGAFVERTEFIPNFGTQTSVSADNATATANINNAVSTFERSGYDLCIYFRDAATATMNHATAIDICGPNGTGIDLVHRDLGGWRLPNIAELAQLGRLVTVNNTATLTQAQVDAFSAGANVPFPNAFLLPAGTQLTHYGTFNNLHRSPYWSSSRPDGTNAWNWYYTTTSRRAWTPPMNSNRWVRCVRSF